MATIGWKRTVIATMKKLGIGEEDYFIYDDHVDVEDSVVFHNQNIQEIPFPFGTITGGFDVANCGLCSLKNCPHTVTEVFSCGGNPIESLEGGPQRADEYYAYETNIKNLIGSPKTVYAFQISECKKLESWKGLPQTITRFRCNNLRMSRYEMRYALLSTIYKMEMTDSPLVVSILMDGRIDGVMPSELIPERIRLLKELI